MSEAGMRTKVTSLLRDYHAFAVENPVLPGTPDVNCTLGWIELKWTKRWPKVGENSIIRLEHFTQQQRIFLLKRHSVDGTGFLLWKCGPHWMLFDGQTAFHRVGKCSRRELLDSALGVWEGSILKEELVTIMKEERND